MSRNEQPITINRISKPHKFDQYPQWTQCVVVNNEGVHYYMQTSSDEENPRWELVKKDKKEDI